MTRLSEILIWYDSNCNGWCMNVVWICIRRRSGVFFDRGDMSCTEYVSLDLYNLYSLDH
jgi:hypothetical protein